MTKLLKAVLPLAMMLLFLTYPGAEAYSREPGPPDPAASDLRYPAIVLYSVSWCSHCKSVKNYFNEKGIIYTNRDVETDSEAMDLLVNRYQSSSVPLIVIGNDEIVLKGFDPEQFEKAMAGYGKAR